MRVIADEERDNALHDPACICLAWVDTRCQDDGSTNGYVNGVAHEVCYDQHVDIVAG